LQVVCTVANVSSSHPPFFVDSVLQLMQLLAE
jgi:hypothetical protein